LHTPDKTRSGPLLEADVQACGFVKTQVEINAQ
jgi:hypothetical protein